MDAEAGAENANDSPVPAAPRAVSARGRRRSWGEPDVRLWWVAALVLVGVGASMAAVNYNNARRDERLIREGVKVEALLISADGKKHPGVVVTTDWNALLEFSFVLPNGKKHQMTGRLKAHREPVTTGKTFTIFVDPNDPSQWTDRKEISPADVLLLPAMVLVPAVLLGIGALFVRARLLNLWKNGEAAVGVVLEVKQAAAAPMSRVVKYTLADRPDGRIYSVVVPVNAGVPAEGETIQVVVDPRRPARALAAAAYI